MTEYKKTLKPTRTRASTREVGKKTLRVDEEAFNLGALSPNGLKALHDFIEAEDQLATTDDRLIQTAKRIQAICGGIQNSAERRMIALIKISYRLKTAIESNIYAIAQIEEAMAATLKGTNSKSKTNNDNEEQTYR